MWEEQRNAYAFPSFRRPVSPPTSGPADGPCVCVSFNEQWAPYILGALQQLAQDSTWRLAPGDDIQVVQGRVNQLMEMFGASNQCGPGPAPVPPGVNPDDFDCGLAGYLVNEIVRQGMQSAIDLATHVGGPQAVLFHLLDFIPFGGDIVAGFGNAITDVAATIGLNTVFNWAQAQLEQGLWDTVGCMVYGIVRGVHGFTADSWATLLSDLRSFGGPSQPFFSAVADMLESWGIGNANAIAELAGSTHYDCSGCSSGGGPTTSSPPVANKIGLTVSDGTATLHNVTDINVSGGAVGGTPDDATLTIAAPWTLDVTDGTVAVIPTQIIQFPPGTVANVAGVAVISGLEGPAGQSPAIGVVSDLTAKYLAIDPETGVPPTGWNLVGFDDSAWAYVVEAPHASFQDAEIPSGAMSVWNTATRPDTDVAQRVLVRQSITLTPGTSDNAQLAGACDHAGDVYVNGTKIAGPVGTNTPPTGSAPFGPVDITSAFTPRGQNVIAWDVQPNTNDSGEPHKRWIAHSLTTGCCGPTGAQGPQGPKGDTGATGAPGSGGTLPYVHAELAQDIPITEANTPIEVLDVTLTGLGTTWLVLGIITMTRQNDTLLAWIDNGTQTLASAEQAEPNYSTACHMSFSAIRTLTAATEVLTMYAQVPDLGSSPTVFWSLPDRRTVDACTLLNAIMIAPAP